MIPDIIHLRAAKPLLLCAFAVLHANATILPGVDIGDGATVAAGAVVTDDVDPDTFVAGVPAQRRRGLRRPKRAARGGP